MIVLAITAEYVDGQADDHRAETTWGEVVVKIGDHEVGRRQLTYKQYGNGRSGLEEAAAEWFRESL